MNIFLRGSSMNKHAKTIKNRLESIIKDITENSHLYVKIQKKILLEIES